MQFLEGGGGGGAFAPNAPSWIRHCIRVTDCSIRVSQSKRDRLPETSETPLELPLSLLPFHYRVLIDFLCIRQ